MRTAIQIDSRREVLSDQLTRGCCIDRLSWQRLSETDPNRPSPLDSLAGPLARLPGGSWQARYKLLQSNAMNVPLKPGQWLDDLPEPLHTVADVKDLFRRVDELKAKRLAEAIRNASRN